MLRLRPVKDKDSYHQKIYREIKHLIDKLIFIPIMEILEEQDVFNANFKALESALRNEKISYSDGYFTGEFNSAIGLELRKMGAKFDKRRKAYFLPEDKVPTEIKIAAARGASKAMEKISKINTKLDELQKTNAVPSINFVPQFNEILVDVDSQIKSSLTEELSLPISSATKAPLEKYYTENLNLYIKDLTDTTVKRLRKNLFQKVTEGRRASELASIIEAEQGMSRRHALFLAKQETSILVSKYRDTRFKEAGVNEYVWSTSHDGRVRPDHKKLDGRRFKFSEPPVTNSATGARNNPGFDYGCRCVAIPVLTE